MYNSASFVGEFCHRAAAAAQENALDYEIIIVNDGSQDGSMEVAKAAQSVDDCIRIVDLSRNFGHHRAVMTGLEYSTGDLVFLLDVDLEEKPEYLGPFLEAMHNQPEVTDVVFGVQKERQGDGLRKFTGSLFYSVFNFLSDVKIPVNLCMIRLMTRRYVDQVLRFPEKQVVLSGLFNLTGYRQVSYPIDKPYKGSTTYGALRNLDMALTAIVSFSQRPLRLIFFLGLFVILLGLGYSALNIFFSLLNGLPVPGFASLLASLWLVGGTLIASVGLVGMYVSTIFGEIKNRPRTIVRECIEIKVQSED